MEKIGVAIVGYGAIGKIHTLAMKQIPFIYPDTAPDFELVGICMTSEEKAKEAATQGGCRKWYRRFEDVLREKGIEF